MGENSAIRLTPVICTLCGSKSTERIVAQGRALIRCAECRLHAVPAGDQIPSEAARARYRLHRNSPEEGYRRFLEPARAAIRKHVPEGARVLDFGAGESRVLAGLLEGDGYSVDCVDPLFDASAVETPPTRYPGVVTTEVMEHFCRPAQDVAALMGHVEPGGTLVVMTLLLTRVIELSTWWYLRDPTHVAFFAPETFAWIACRFGLELAETDHERLLVFRRRIESSDREL